MKVSFATLAVAALAAALPANAFAPSANRPIAKILPQQQKVSNHHPFAKTTNQVVTRSSSTSYTTTVALAAGVGSGTDLFITDGAALSQSLIKLLLETLIVNGVPALFTVFVIGFAAWQFRPSKKNDQEDEYGRMTDPFTNRKKNPAAELYSDLYEGDDDDELGNNNKPMSPFRFFKLFKSQQPTPAATNRGIPALQYISITNLNQKYASYDYSLTAATQSKAKAAAAYRAQNFDRALRLAVNSNINGGDDGEIITLTPFAKTTLLELERDFLKDGSKLLNAIQAAQVELTKNAIEEEMDAMGMELYELDPYPSEVNSTQDSTSNITITNSVAVTNKKDSKKDHKATKPKRSTEAIFTYLLRAQKDLMKVELDFVKDVIATLGTERASGVRTALLGDIAARGTGGLLTQLQDRPLSMLLQGGSDATATTTTTDNHPKDTNGNSHRRKSLFVTNFPGDVQASQVAELREEVTAIVRNAKPGDEALVILQTGGGTVTGYGLAAAQLLRFKDAGMKLTVAVEQVAASGGYMMCCVADKIVSSPFAVLGSIGVISDIPNVYERLKKEGM
jgi:Peptidase family S49 N-terminal/Peptidase family S49